MRAAETNQRTEPKPANHQSSLDSRAGRQEGRQAGRQETDETKQCSNLASCLMDFVFRFFRFFFFFLFCIAGRIFLSASREDD